MDVAACVAAVVLALEQREKQPAQPGLRVMSATV